METNIEKCIVSIFESIQTENELESVRLLGEAIEYAKESEYKLDNPENFNVFINSKLKNAVNTLANALHEPSVSKDRYKPNLIFGNYGFFKSNIEKLCELREGFGCAADKSRYIIKMYLEYSITGVIPAYNLQKEQYWKPKFGDNEMWIAFCDGLYRLHYGNPNEYLIAYNNLVQCDKKQFKHELHRWFIEFNDGKIVEFDSRWDEDVRNPLTAMDKGDFYLISKNKVPDRGFEEYTPGEEDQYLLNFYVKMPKSEINKIYKESEDKMV